MTEKQPWIITLLNKSDPMSLEQIFLERRAVGFSTSRRTVYNEILRLIADGRLIQLDIPGQDRRYMLRPKP
jgi:Fe2+ or Zn2+ uptake regulation protein